MIELDQCCCGCSLKTGSKIIGWLNLIGNLLLVALSIIILVGLKDSKSDLSEKDKHIVAIFSWILLVLSCINMAVTISMLYGVYKDLAGYILPWIILSTISAAYTLGSAIMEVVDARNFGNLVVHLVHVALLIYFILVVYSHYRVLRRESTGYA